MLPDRGRAILSEICLICRF